MGRITIIMALLLNSLIIEAQDITVRAWFDSTRIMIGDQVNYNFEVKGIKGENIIFPEFKDTLVKGVEIIESAGFDTVATKDNGVTVLNRLLVTSFDTGYYQVPPAYIEVKDENGLRRVYSDYNLFEVIRADIAPADSTDIIFDIAGPRKAGVTLMEIVPWVLLLAVIGIVLFYLLQYFRKRSAPVKEEKSLLPSEPINIIALRELDKLERSQLWQKSQHKEYYTRLTEILRVYIDKRFSIASMEMTSGETLNALLRAGLSRGGLYDMLREILTTADLSKFAKFQPDEALNISSLSMAKSFVKASFKEEKDDVMINEEGKEVSYE